MSNIHIEFGSDIDTKSNLNFINKDVNTNWLNDSYLFRSARDILKYIAKLKKNDFSNRILMPILCCDSMVKPFTDNGYDVVFYPLKSDYTIDTDFINDNIKPNDIILVENYLSLKSNSSTTSEDNFIIDLKNKFPLITIIKDYTHSLKDALYENKSVEDFSIFSVRKWASFPDGGILWSNTKLDISFDNYNSKYFDLKKKAMDLKSDYLENHNPEIKQEFLNLFKEADIYLEESQDIIGISEYSKNLLYTLDFEKILKTRIDHINYLKERITSIKTLLNMETCSGLYFPIYVEKNQKEFQKYLATNSIYCPVIWPLAEGYENFSELSTDIISHMLAVPCDQRYSYEDLDYIISKLNNINNII